MARQSRAAPELSILLTRPAAQSERFARDLRARFGPDLSIVISPLLAPRFVVPTLPSRRPAALVFTSETGVAGFARISENPGLPAWCVGSRTARAAAAAGFAARDVQGDADALIRTILAADQAGPLLYIRGRDQAAALADTLRKAGLETDEAIVYQQEVQPLSAKGAALFTATAPVVAPLFSARTASVFAGAQAAASRRAPLWIAALSDGVARAAAAARPDRLAIADQPDADALLVAIAKLVPVAGQP